MSQQISASIVNAVANIITTTMNDGYLDIYSGSPGATPDDTSGGVLLCTVKLPLVAFSAPTNGVCTLTGQWFGTVYTSGVAAWARFRDPTNLKFIVLTLTATGGGGQITLDNTTLTANGVVSITGFTYTIPAGS